MGMAGNYAVRNSPWGVAFVDGWAAYDAVDVPSGYHSSDNGAIHLHVLRSLRIRNHILCSYLWDRLRSGVMDLDPYYRYVDCTRVLMAPPRRWTLDGVRRLTILPRGHAWVVDGAIVNHQTSSVGAVMHHGQKNQEDFLRYFTQNFVFDKAEKPTCADMLVNTAVTQEKYIDSFVSSNVLRFNGDFQVAYRVAVPPWETAYAECIKTLSCQPLDDESPLVVNFLRPLQSRMPFVRVTKEQGQLMKECATEGGICHCVGIVKFGTEAEGIFLRVTVDPGKIKCYMDAFDGNDPLPGVKKHCFCLPDA